MNAATLPDELADALADALGRVVADVQREWRKDVDRISAESRLVVAELRLQVFTLTAALKEASDQQAARVGEAIAAIKNGEPGDPGKDADPQVAAEIAAKLVSEELSGIIRADVAAIHAGIEDMAAGLDGKITERVATAVAALPVPKDGEPGIPGIDGRDGDPGTPGKDGVDGAAGRDGIDGEPGKDGVGEPGPPGRDGVDGRDGAAGADGKDGEPGVPGRSVDPEEARALVVAEVETAIKARPVPTDGHTPTAEELAPIVDDAVRAAVDALPRPKDGEDGRSITPADVADMISAEVTTAVGALPVPKDGTPVDPVEVERMVASQVGTAMELVLAANDDCVPDDLAETVSRAIRALAESPALAPATAAMPSLVLNLTAGGAERRPSSKTITTRRDDAGNLIADVVEA